MRHVSSRRVDPRSAVTVLLVQNPRWPNSVPFVVLPLLGILRLLDLPMDILLLLHSKPQCLLGAHDKLLGHR